MDTPKITGEIRMPVGCECSRMVLNGMDFSSLCWDIYNFVNAYKKGTFGEVPLSQAICKDFVKFQQNYLKGVKEFGSSK